MWLNGVMTGILIRLMKDAPEKDPQGPKSGSKKVVRGGAYNQAPVTITGRDAQQPTTASPYIGFRVVNKI